MSSTITDLVGASSALSQVSGRHHHRQQDSSKLASELFSSIDTSGKGYIEKSDLESAFQKLSSSSTSSTAAADQLFSTLDANADGKVTQDEMTSGIKKLSAALDSQFQSARMNAAMAGAGSMPPPPPANDAGFTKDQLQSQIDQIGSTDSKRSALLSKIVANFSAADTNGDGKVSFQEAMAYDQSTSSSTTTVAATATSSTASTDSGTTSTSDAQLMLQVMKLAQAYGIVGHHQQSSTVSAAA